MNQIAQPVTAPWPPSFSVTFVTNVTGAEAQKDGAWGRHAVKGELFFEASRRQRIVHGAGARECVRFYNTTGDCALVFAEDAGMFALTERDAKCCIDMPELETPPANWTTQASRLFHRSLARSRSRPLSFSLSLYHLSPSLSLVLACLLNMKICTHARRQSITSSAPSDSRGGCATAFHTVFP